VPCVNKLLRYFDLKWKDRSRGELHALLSLFADYERRGIGARDILDTDDQTGGLGGPNVGGNNHLAANNKRRLSSHS